MSIRIHHGYRVGNTTEGDVDGFLATVEAAVAPVRDALDAALYAAVLAGIYDSRDHLGTSTDSPLKQAALDQFRSETTSGNRRTVWHHPHSFDLDYAVRDNGWLYALVHCQRDQYRTAFASIPGVQPYPYQTSSGRPNEVSEEAWEQRRTDWQWLIDAPSIAAVMSRWSYRPSPEPNLAHILDDEVILAAQPSLHERARNVALQQAAREQLPHTDTNPIEAYITLMGSRLVDDLTDHIASNMRTLVHADLT